MKRWICLLAAAAPGLLSGAMPLGAEVIRGYVLHGTDGRPIAEAEVALLARQDAHLGEIQRQPTDADGRFALSDTLVSSGSSFVLVAFYQGIPYPSAELVAGGQKEVILEVYEPTTSDDAIRITGHTLFLGLSASRLEVAHFTQVENRGDKTYVGRGQGPKRQVLEFALPPGLIHLSENVNQFDGARFFDNRPLPPGMSQVIVTFELDPREAAGGYRHQVLYPTERMEILLQPATLQPGPPFEDLGVEDVHGARYRRLLLRDLHRGQSVLIPLPLSPPRRWMLKWAALGAALIAGLLALVLRRRSPAGPGSETADLRAERERRLQQLADLDDAYAEDRDHPRYRSERAELMAQALALSRRLEESAADA